MINVTGLKKYFKTRNSSFFEEQRYVKAVNDISFSIPEGKTLGLVGESGSGKTTVSRAILRLMKFDSGKIIIDGTEVGSLKKSELRKFRKNMQLVFQDPFASLNPRMIVGKIITEPLKIHKKIKKNLLLEKQNELLELVGLRPEHGNRYPHEFSGGQRQRIGIARAIALNPKFIILDEPVSALDVSIQGQILNLLKDLQNKLNFTYLFIAHDLAVIEHMCDRIAVMYLGKIVEENSKENLYNNPLHPYTKSLLKSIPGINPGEKKLFFLKGEIPSNEDLPKGCYFFPRCEYAKEICSREYPEIKEIDGAKIACHLY